jgi:hemerythrin
LGIKFTDDLRLGIASIDEQHEELFRRVNSVVDAVGPAESHEQVAEALAYLEQYVLRHFHDEEKLMEELEYPLINKQRRDHARFLELFEQFKTTFESGDPARSLASNMQFRLTGWLVTHVCGADRDLAEFVHALNPASPKP